MIGRVLKLDADIVTKPNETWGNTKAKEFDCEFTELQPVLYPFGVEALADIQNWRHMRA